MSGEECPAKTLTLNLSTNSENISCPVLKRNYNNAGQGIVLKENIH